jgi:hypothetical protein
MMYITRATVAAAIREARAELIANESYTAYYRRQFAGCEPFPDHWMPKTRSEINAAAVKVAREKTVPAYGWPGGYDLAYYPTDEYGSLTGDELCWGCARKELQDNKGIRLHVESTDGYEGGDSHNHLYCDDCGGVIREAWQRDPADSDLFVCESCGTEGDIEDSFKPAGELLCIDCAGEWERNRYADTAEYDTPIAAYGGN